MRIFSPLDQFIFSLDLFDISIYARAFNNLLFYYLLSWFRLEFNFLNTLGSYPDRVIDIAYFLFSIHNPAGVLWLFYFKKFFFTILLTYINMFYVNIIWIMFLSVESFHIIPWEFFINIIWSLVFLSSGSVFYIWFLLVYCNISLAVCFLGIYWFGFLLGKVFYVYFFGLWSTFAFGSVTELSIFLEESHLNRWIWHGYCLSLYSTLSFAFLSCMSFAIISFNLKYAFNAVVNKLVISSKRELINFFYPLLACITVFIVFCNFKSALPFSFSFTSYLSVCFMISLSVFTLFNVIFVKRFSIFTFSLLIPQGAPFLISLFLIPIELISYLVRPISLSIRLFANLISGHTLVHILICFACKILNLYGLIGSILPFVLINFILIAEIVIVFLQAYIFIVLTCLYINETSSVADKPVFVFKDFILNTYLSLRTIYLTLILKVYFNHFILIKFVQTLGWKNFILDVQFYSFYYRVRFSYLYASRTRSLNVFIQKTLLPSVEGFICCIIWLFAVISVFEFGLLVLIFVLNFYRLVL